MFNHLLSGLKTTVRNYRLVLIIWGWHLALAAVATAPALGWWRQALNHSLDATTLLKGFSFAVLADVTKYDGVGGFGLLTSAMAAAVLLSILASAFIMGGALNVLSGSGPARGLMHRFFGGGGCFFWRFFRLMLIAGVCVMVVGSVLTVALVAIESPLTGNVSETGAYVWLLVNLVVLAIACGLFLLALDYARIQVVVDDARGMFWAYLRALGFVARHAVTAYGMAVLVLVAAGVLMLGYVAYETVSPVASSWSAIFLLVLIQQVITSTRVGLRVSLVDAELHYYRRVAPPLTVVVDAAHAAKVAPATVGVAEQTVSASTPEPGQASSTMSLVS